jgi:vanillate O-demethylase monooxygenase subunit
MRNTYAITPETDKTTHYFWTQAHDFMLDDPSITELLRHQIYTAFLEDLSIIKAQQANIDLDPNAKRWDINHDGGGLAMRRMLDKMIADDGGPGGRSMRSAAE